jgi:hypothetical protein
MLGTSKKISTFPLTPWTKAQVLSIQKAVEDSWRSINQEDLCSLNENNITDRLRTALEGVIDTDLFSSHISKGEELSSYDNSSIDKRPDITIRRIESNPGLRGTKLHQQDGLFIECKIVTNNTTNIKRYIEDGIDRFIDGRYAWGMRHAMMLGYLREDTDLSTKLKDNLNSLQRNTQYIQYLSSRFHQVQTTIHPRSWIHPDYGPSTEIRLDHIWLKISSQ